MIPARPALVLSPTRPAVLGTTPHTATQRMALPFLVLGNFFRSLRSSDRPASSSSASTRSTDDARRAHHASSASLSLRDGAPEPAMTIPATRPDMSKLRQRTSRGDEEANVGLHAGERDDSNARSSSPKRPSRSASSTSSAHAKPSRAKRVEKQEKGEKEQSRAHALGREGSRTSSGAERSESSAGTHHHADKPTCVHQFSENVQSAV